MPTQLPNGFLPVCVAQGDAKMPGDGLKCGAGNVDQCSDDDKHMDGGPADDEDGHHHQYHASDTTEVLVFLLRFTTTAKYRQRGPFRTHKKYKTDQV